MQYLYKLSFKDKQTWQTVLATFSTEGEEGELVFPFIFIEIGHIPFEPVYDELGEVDILGGEHEDYAVDVITDKLIPKLKEYLIEEKTHYHHAIAGGEYKIITK